ncbi:glutathione S-transferase [Delitschia confertaspora ATCC 74209]|uniref:Glutathione S-transferase n=1 Tax=Delitschia confertaspora ATCC 74209 TaxID=1513339 RepID=A0A9P4JC38_9PLEO|nr:glutathione S-transferase [Delitschia confertaspora ATCC 74209]
MSTPSLTPHTTLPTLYHHPESAASYKVLLLASHLSIPLHRVLIDLPADQNKSPAYLAINPRGSIPALIHGKHTFNDSAAILCYLAGSYSDKGKWGIGPSSYWSGDAGEQAEIVDWLSFSSSWIQFGVFTVTNIISFGGARNGVGTYHTESTLEEAKIRAYKSLEILDKHLEKEKWLALNRPTIADIACFASVACARMGDIDYAKWENVGRWVDRVKGIEGWVTSRGIEDPMYMREGRGPEVFRKILEEAGK